MVGPPSPELFLDAWVSPGLTTESAAPSDEDDRRQASG